MRRRDILARALAAHLLTSAPALAQPLAGGAPPPLSRDSLAAWMARLSNAGRWGRADQLGTLNLITPAKRHAAAQSVRDGVSISLAGDVVPRPGPDAAAPVPIRLDLTRLGLVVLPVGDGEGAFDSLLVVAHGFAASHVDALSHVVYRGRLYNGVGCEELAPTGAKALGVEAMRSGIVTRGVLVDLPRLGGVPHLPDGTAVTAADLERWERRTGVRIGAGDVLLLRTGRAARAPAAGPWGVRTAAGPHPSLAAWLRARGVSVLGGDGTNEHGPSAGPGVAAPMHVLAIVALGMPLLDNLDLEALAEYAARRSRHTFLFVAGPLPIRGGTGSLVNPLAIF